MQSKGAIKFFAIAFALVCLFQLSFTFVTTRVANKAESYAYSDRADKLAKELSNGDVLRESYILDSIHKAFENYYLDSMSNQVVYDILIRDYTYKEAKEREINLGLDLKGGMNVTLEINVGDIVNALSGYNQNPVFRQVLSQTYQKQRSSSDDFITLFDDTWEEVAPGQSLAAVFSTVELKDKISYNATNLQVIDVIREEAQGAIDRSFNILRTRIDRFGVSQPNIQMLATSGRILVELPGIKDPARVRKLLQGTAKLEFWETFQLPEIVQYLVEANNKLRKIQSTEEAIEDDRPELSEVQETNEEVLEAVDDKGTTEDSGSDLLNAISETEDDTTTSLLDQIESDTALATQDRSFEEYAKENPLFAYLLLNIERETNRPIDAATVGYASIKDTARINNMLKKVRNTTLPSDLRLVWTHKPRQEGTDVLELVALKATGRNRSAALFGDVIVDARQDYDQNGRVEVTMSMNSEGARVWKRLTGDNIGKQVAIILDGYVYSYPNVNSEIPNGRSSISGGSMSIEEAKDLANILKAGKLPAPARIVEEEVVGPSLGAEAVNAGLWSFILAFTLVLLYMILYYNRAGWVADLALLTNIFFLFGVLASLGAVLTLPGIAGIVLTLGMAVDANVIIYERIKEEVRAGKGIRLAISDGYKNAYSAIIDGNVTTLLTGIVLYVFGTGPVQGFATTLIIGILSSLFSSIFISRLIFTWFLDKNKKINFHNKFTQSILANTKFDFLKLRKGAYIFSSIIIILGVASLFTRGLNLGIDFSGGRTYVVRFDKPVSTSDIRASLTSQFDNNAPEVKTFGPTTQVKITTKYLIENNEPSVDSLIQIKLYDGLKQFYGADLEYITFSSDIETEDKLLGILSSQKVGPTIADDIRNKAIMAIVFALIVIFVYIAIRFRKWQYGLAGVIALFHDSMITIGLFSLFYNILPFSMEIDQAFIAAILTIIGYSINDTVIIFDRIREYTGLFPKKDIKSNINAALNSTLARTINTSGTTLVVLFIIFIFGGEIIRGFTFALLVGILIGTYSSLFNASPIVYDLMGGDRKVKVQLSKVLKTKKGKK